MTQQLMVSTVERDRVLLDAGSVRSFLGEKKRIFWVPRTNDLDIQEGNWVELNYPSGRSLLDIFLFLVVPILLMITIASYLPDTISEGMQVAYSLLGLPAGLLIFLGAQAVLPKLSPEITKVIPAPEDGKSKGCGTCATCVCK